MTDTLLALLITVGLLVGMAAFVPVLVFTERMLKADTRPVVREVPEESVFVPVASAEAEAA